MIKFTKVKILWNNLFRFSEPEKVLSAVFKSSFINFFARIFGYLKNFIIAILLGFSYQTDGFFMAISLIGIFLIFVDVFDSIGVPFEVQIFFTPLPFYGIGIVWVANLNPIQSDCGAFLCLQIGLLR